MSRYLKKNQTLVFDPEAVWQHILLLDRHYKFFTLEALSDLMMINTKTNMKLKITHYIAELVFAKILAVNPYNDFILRRKSDYAPPLSGLTVETRKAYQALWTAMRSLHSFSSIDLARAASIDDHGISPYTARSFCKLLVEAGYAHQRAKLYTLLPHKNTGPRAPILRPRDGIIYDLNHLMPAVNVTEKSRRAA